MTYNIKQKYGVLENKDVNDHIFRFTQLWSAVENQKHWALCFVFQVITFLKKKEGFIGLVLKHIDASAMMDLLLRLISCVEPAPLRQEVLHVSSLNTSFASFPLNGMTPLDWFWNQVLFLISFSTADSIPLM